MSEASDLAGQATNPDPTVGLRAALALRKLAETLERLQVDNARRQGWSWQDIAAALHVSKQAVHKRYSAGSPSVPVSAPVSAPSPGATGVPSSSPPSSNPVAMHLDSSSHSHPVPDPVEG